MYHAAVVNPQVKFENYSARTNNTHCGMALTHGANISHKVMNIKIMN
jgi:hypothetical protein